MNAPKSNGKEPRPNGDEPRPNGDEPKARKGGGGQPGADHLGVQGGQEPLLVVVGEPVGVVGERGFLRQDG